MSPHKILQPSGETARRSARDLAARCSPTTGAVPTEPARTAACVALRSDDGRMRARLVLSEQMGGFLQRAGECTAG